MDLCDVVVLNIELIIIEVEKYSVLFNTFDENYKNRM